MNLTREQLLKIGYPVDDLRKVLGETVPTTLKPGELLCAFNMQLRARPWSVPRKMRRKNPKLSQYQNEVSLAASRAMGGRPPYTGLVSLDLVFDLKYAGSMPDGTNLVKATEDALEGTIIVNDRQVRHCSYDYDSEAVDDHVSVRVVAYSRMRRNEGTK